MEAKLICQSCTMPIDDISDRGTEKDGSRSKSYCKYCYENGAFTDPGTTLEEMKSNMIDQMEKEHIPSGIIEQSIRKLSGLERWKVQG